MNNLSNDGIKEVVGVLSRHPESYFGGVTSLEVASALNELLAYREAAKNPVAVTGEDEVSNMQATGLYLRAWPADRERNEVEGYTIKLYAAPPLSAVNSPVTPDGCDNTTQQFESLAVNK